MPPTFSRLEPAYKLLNPRGLASGPCKCVQPYFVKNKYISKRRACFPIYMRSGTTQFLMSWELTCFPQNTTNPIEDLS